MDISPSPSMALRPSVEVDGLGHNTVMSCCHWHWVLSLVEDMPLGRWPWRWAAEAPRRSTSRRPEHLRLRQGWRLVVGFALGPRWQRHRQQRHVGRGGQGAPLAGGAGHLGGHAAWTVGAEMGLGQGLVGLRSCPDVISYSSAMTACLEAPLSCPLPWWRSGA